MMRENGDDVDETAMCKAAYGGIGQDSDHRANGEVNR
jgi:hypothetical protein